LNINTCGGVWRNGHFVLENETSYWQVLIETSTTMIIPLLVSGKREEKVGLSEVVGYDCGSVFGCSNAVPQTKSADGRLA